MEEACCDVLEVSGCADAAAFLGVCGYLVGQSRVESNCLALAGFGKC